MSAPRPRARHVDVDVHHGRPLARLAPCIIAPVRDTLSASWSTHGLLTIFATSALCGCVYLIYVLLSTHNCVKSHRQSRAQKVRNADTVPPCCLPQDRPSPPCWPSADAGTQPFDLPFLMGDLAGDFGCRIEVSPCSQGGAGLSGPDPP